MRTRAEISNSIWKNEPIKSETSGAVGKRRVTRTKDQMCKKLTDGVLCCCNANKRNTHDNTEMMHYVLLVHVLIMKKITRAKVIIV